MKRGFLKIITTFLLLALCFSLSAPVYADYTNVEKVKIKSGDMLQTLCQARGLDYYRVKDTIMQLNGFTSASQLDKIRVGDTILLPAAAGTGSSASSANSLAYKAAIASTGVTSQSAAYAGDAVSYYVVVYTLRYGDTLNSIYNSWGLNYSSYASMISKLNNAVNLDALSEGQTLFLPVAKSIANVPISYTIFEHTVRVGETMTSICMERGIDLGQFSSTLQLFNPGIDFNRINVNQRIFYPATGGTALPAASAVTVPAANTAAVQPAAGASPAAAQKLPPQNPVLQNINELYVGYGVVISKGDYLCVRLETEGCDVYLTYTPSVLNGYTPRSGDYAKLIFTPTDFLLASVSYVYNVFEQ